MKEILWPVTIIESRYGGTYEYAKFLAFNISPGELGETDAMGCDFECQLFFKTTKLLIGRGSDPNGALLDLERQFHIIEI